MTTTTKTTRTATEVINEAREERALTADFERIITCLSHGLFDELTIRRADEPGRYVLTFWQTQARRYGRATIDLYFATDRTLMDRLMSAAVAFESMGDIEADYGTDEMAVTYWAMSDYVRATARLTDTTGKEDPTKLAA